MFQFIFMVFYFLSHILKIKMYEIIEFMVSIFICEFFALILYFIQIFPIFLLINYSFSRFTKKIKIKNNY